MKIRIRDMDSFKWLLDELAAWFHVKTSEHAVQFRSNDVIWVKSCRSTSNYRTRAYQFLTFCCIFFSHLALIARVHCSISVTWATNFALSQFTPCSKFGIAWIALAGITSECICTCVLAGILQAFIHVCKNRTLLNTGGNPYDLVIKGYVVSKAFLFMILEPDVA